MKATFFEKNNSELKLKKNLTLNLLQLLHFAVPLEWMLPWVPMGELDMTYLELGEHLRL